MRNIAYLKVAELIKNTPADKLLIWSLDSDQEFCVKVATPEGDREVYAIDYFHDLDAIFSRTDALVLTGKVVGDPPVSPAVMAGNFLADVLGFLQRMAASDPAAACRQHGDAGQAGGEATYHDMADLFGFKQAATAYRYRCTLAGAHSEADCCAHFAARLNSFFYGEHPTRISYYQPADLLRSVQPARTVYQGNYVFRPQALKYFAPFATLRLRMSGPTLGRIIQAEIGARFVSANLPMLHKRTLESGGQSEFRPGIATATEMIAPVIDISGEFERQFYGDVMLFSIERLAREHSIRHPASAAQQVPLGCTTLWRTRWMPCAPSYWKSTTAGNAPLSTACRYSTSCCTIPPAGGTARRNTLRPLPISRPSPPTSRTISDRIPRATCASTRQQAGRGGAPNCSQRSSLIRPTARPGRRNFARTEALAASPPAPGALRPARRTARHPGADPRATAAQAAP